MSGEPAIFQVGRLDLSFTPQPWAFSLERKAEIGVFFAALKRQVPAIWNGRVLLLQRHHVADGVFSGEYLETDYASFAAWRAWGRPPAGIHDCFGAAAIIAADGAVLLGVMGGHTANAGRIYFPCGTPDPADVVDGRVDLDLSMARELREETGLDIAEFEVEPDWTTVIDGALICQVKKLRSTLGAEALCKRATTHIARERNPELAGIRVVRAPSDFDPAMPRFVTAFLMRHFVTQ